MSEITINQSAVDLVDYQPGAVVSRVILKKKTGNVTLFAFDAGQGLSEHTAPFEALLFILEGGVDVTVSGRTIKAKAGRVVLLPAGAPHSLEAPQPAKLALIMIRS